MLLAVELLERHGWILMIVMVHCHTAQVKHLKTELHNIHRGAGSVEKFLLKFKCIWDQVYAAGVKTIDDDVIIAVLNGLSPEFDMIRIVSVARETPFSLKELRAQLLSAETNIESRISHLF